MAAKTPKEVENEKSAPVAAEVKSASGTVAVLSNSQKAMTLPNGMVVTSVKKVTLPLLKHGDGQTVLFTVKEAMRLGKQLKAKSADEPAPKRAMMLRIIDAQSGMEMEYIVPAVLQDTFDTDYPDNSYIGKSFMILKMPKQEGKRHKDLQIEEVSISAPKQ